MARKKSHFSILTIIFIIGTLNSSCFLSNKNVLVNPNKAGTILFPASTGNPLIVESPSNQTYLHNGAEESLQTLMAANVPEKDVNLIARKFKKIDENNLQSVEIRNYRKGDERKFWVLNTTSNEYKLITADLVFITPHSYFWVQQGVAFDEKDVAIVSGIFDDKIYPTNRAFFGSEPIPGIDGDVHISILYTKGMGWLTAGLFSSADSVTSVIDQYSNQAEMIYISADYVNLSNHDYVAEVMAHELQHLIHYSLDRNEVSWISEGFSELATFINGYGPSDFDFSFAMNPNLQLTFWPGDDQGDSTPHYGAAFMFMKYFLDRFGEEATKSLVAERVNDYQSVELVLERLNKSDLTFKTAITGDEFFRDWTITNLINSFNTDNQSKYKYEDYRPPAFSVEKIAESNIPMQKSTVKQFGTQYYEMNCKSDCTLELQSRPTVRILPESPHSGNYYVWSNKGDESEMVFSREFDFRNHSGAITLQYWTWYEIEKDYDYLYLTASDDGENWKIIHTPGCTMSNPTGANFGCGYSGKSNHWIQEKVDLSEYAGKKVTIKFDYITDLAVNGAGLVLDDISIPEIGYFEDFESGKIGWLSDGFVRIQNILPQKYLVTLVQVGNSVQVTPLFFDHDGKVKLTLKHETGAVRNYLVISGMTKHITTPADYEIKLSNE